MREKSFWNVANDGIDDPRKSEGHGAAEFDSFDLNVSSSVFFFDVPPGTEFPQITARIGGRKFTLVWRAEIFYVSDANGAGPNLRTRGRVVRGARSEIDVENRSDDGLAIELQKNFAVVSVLREQSGLADVRKIIFLFVSVIFQNGFGLREGDAGKKCDADPVMDDAAGNVDVVAIIEGMKLFEKELVAAELRVDFVAARAGKLVDVQEVTSEEIGVHTRLGFVAVMVKGGESFRFGLVGAGRRSKKGNGASDQG